MNAYKLIAQMRSHLLTLLVALIEINEELKAEKLQMRKKKYQK